MGGATSSFSVSSTRSSSILVFSIWEFGDIVLWDPNQFRSLATFSKPEEIAQDAVHLLVNSQLAIYFSQLTGHANGQVLSRHQCDQK